MSKPSNKNSQDKSAPIFESQKDRWIKYGSNVGLSVVLVVALGIGLVWFAQRSSWRKDVTANGSLSLKAQSDNVLKDLKQHITLVSLYVRPDNQPDQIAQAQRVADLLDEYKDKNGNIDVKVIDPAKEKDKLEDLHQDFINRYGSQIKSYKDYLEKWQLQFDEIKKLTDAESKEVGKFNTPQVGGEDQDSPVAGFVSTITDELPSRLNDARKAVDHELKKKHPDYKAASTTAKEQMQLVSSLAGSIIEQAPKAQAAKQLPADFRQYLADSVPHYQKMKDIADGVIAAGNKLGELKVDELEQALNVDNPILVLGDNEWRVLSPTQVWQDDPDVRAINAGAKVKPRFAGEQQVTTAIYALEHPKKQKVCFVRPGGAPFTQPGFPPFVPGGPLSTLAEHLRQYNFDVTEKDLSGMWAMQAQAQQQPAPPEPSDADIKDAIWVVLDVPVNEQQQQAMPPMLSPKLKEHLEQGGSALVLADIRGDDLAAALTGWGVTIHPGAVAVHETIKLSDAADVDPLEEAKARAYIWDCRKYGDHELAQPIQNLDSVFVAPVCISTSSANGCTITPLLPFSDNMPSLKTWGDTNIENLDKGVAEFNDKTDVAAPVFGGAVVDKQGGGRLVAIGSVRSFTNGFLRIPDPKLARRDPPVIVNEFPGNMELATNSIFWLAHLEPMIAISPAAMDVSRIADMSNGTLNFWRIGVLLIILPGVVLCAGAFVYMARRD